MENSMKNPLHPPGLPSCVGADALSGCWKLGDGRALTLRPTQPGVLRMAHGRVWVTFDNARQDDGVRGGDHFLGAGEVLQLLPGQVLVMESWNGAKDAAAYFSWDPLPATAGIAITSASRRVLAGGARWRGGVAQPLRDLRLALGLAGTASGRLAVGLAGVSAAAVRALAPRLRY
jgi:Protein of unknown function (DUF2917)